MVRAIELTENHKLGPMHATYVSQESCPTSCPLRNRGCYAENGPVGIMTRRLNKAAVGKTPLELAQAEAEAIEALSGRFDLRLHVVGDCITNEAASIVAKAATEKMRRGHKAFGFTHAWREVDRESWGTVSMLASAETPEQVKEAQKKGWATATIVPEFPTKKLYETDGLKILPCPSQTSGVSCSECRLCMKDRHLRDKGITIGFLAHGARFKRVLEVLDEEGGIETAGETPFRKPTLTSDGRKKVRKNV